MPVYGLRPDDVVTDTAGNVQTGATLTLHATQADAQAAVSPLASVVTSAGRWSADVAQSPVWVRTPNGAVYQITDFSAKADKTYVDTQLSGKLDTTTAGTTYETQTSAANRITNEQTRADAAYEGKQSTFRSPGTADQTTALTNFLAAASPLGVKQLIGSFNISNQITVPANTLVDGSAATLTQTATSKAAVLVNSGATINGLTIVGVGTDYVNSSSVYLSAGFLLASNASNVTLRNCRISNMAGAGVYAPSAPTKLRVLDCDIAGLGTGVVTAGGQWSGGVVINADGASDILVRGGSISGFAQGIVTGNISDIRVTGVRIANIPGQHGIYLGSASRYSISGNLIDNTYLEGIKIQIASTSAPDAVDGAITGNTISRCGSHGIHLAQTVGSTPRHRRVSITGNTATSIGSGTNLGDGVYLECVEGAQIIGNHLSNGRNGVYATTCVGLTIGHNRISGCADRGIGLLNASDVDILGNRIRDVATANNTTTEFGIHVDGASSADLRIIDNKVTDALGNMRYALYVGGTATAANQGTMTVLNNVLTGATDYGARMIAAASTARWSGNTLGGTTGAVLNPPTNYATNPDTSGAALATLESEVNELKALLRANGLLAP